MSTIGYFKKNGENSYVGEIVTLNLRAAGVKVVSQDGSDNDKLPTHRVYIGRAEIGAGWSKVSEDGREYVSLKLDDPSFNAPIYANLFEDQDSEGYTLLWSRPRKNSL